MLIIFYPQWHSLLHDVLEVVAKVSVESVLVEWFVDDLIGCRHIPYSRDEQHSSDVTLSPKPLTHTQVLKQHHAVL